MEQQCEGNEVLRSLGEKTAPICQLCSACCLPPIIVYICSSTLMDDLYSLNGFNLMEFINFYIFLGLSLVLQV